MNLRRFAKIHKPQPGRVRSLAKTHPAIVSGRTIFPSKVEAALDAPRLLVSGLNNRKIGSEVRKGPWAGMSIYMLTLEERATCPRACSMWTSCYGNAMHLARRHRHGADLEARLQREIKMLARENPIGFVVRLHVLGDFYSTEYVQLWIDLMARHPELHLFGYTARSISGDDLDKSIAVKVAKLNAAFEARCFIRTSARLPAPGGASVISNSLPVQGAFVCPAETEKSECCATCGLCWAVGVRDKAVLFLKHGMMGGRRRMAA